MRKDVRFGLAIGGSLLALLVICAALFDRGPSNTSNDVAVQPGSQPEDSPQNAPPPQSNAPAMDLTARADSGAMTRPSSVANESSTARDWNTLLLTGDAGGDPSATRPAVIKAAYTEGPASRPSEGRLSAAPTHKIAPGETFSTIAAAVYGDSKYYLRLEDANPGVNPNRLRVGTIINVPPLNEPLAPKSAAPRDLSAANTPATPLDSSKSYRVRPSDTLMAIARRLYGDGQAWQKIYDANRDAIGPNPARLQVGMVLRLPAPPTAVPAN
jgi:nucleoid-associated protein YgaU